MECLGYRRRSHRFGLTTIPTMELAYANGTESVTAYVFLEDRERVLDWSDQSYPGRDLGAFVDALATVGTFTASAEVAENLGLIQRRESGRDDSDPDR